MAYLPSTPISWVKTLLLKARSRSRTRMCNASYPRSASAKKEARERSGCSSTCVRCHALREESDRRSGLCLAGQGSVEQPLGACTRYPAQFTQGTTTSETTDVCGWPRHPGTVSKACDSVGIGLGRQQRYRGEGLFLPHQGPVEKPGIARSL
jgi:hypothetical protein